MRRKILFDLFENERRMQGLGEFESKLGLDSDSKIG
jgi:hypothetical protein